MTVKLKSTGWELGGEYLPWVWGQINYWDIERSSWHDVLKTYHLAGHRVVATNVLPRIHQLANGEYDFGKVKPQLDLAAFLNEAKEIGIKVFLWAGPRYCPGAGAAGYPLGLLENEAALAKDAEGNFVLSSMGFGGEVFSLPNLISNALKDALLPFAEAMKNAVHSNIHPDGPVIGMGLTQAPGWTNALSAFSADYSTETVSYYQNFLKKQYSKIDNLNKAYGSNFSNYHGIHPPQSMETENQFPERRLLDWARFKEEYFIQAAEKLHDVFSPVTGDKIPVFLSALEGTTRPLNLAELEKSRCFQYALPQTSGLDASGMRIAAQARYLLAMNAGFSNAEDRQDELRYQFMEGIASGVRGWDAISPAGSGCYPGFVSNRQGKPVRKKPQVWELLKEFSESDFFLQSQIHNEVLLLTLPEFERSLYLQKAPDIRLDLLGMLGTGNLDKPLEVDDFTKTYSKRFSQIEQYLVQRQYPFLVAEGDATTDRLSKTALVMVPSMVGMEPAVQQLLAGLVDKGIHVVLIGEMPDHPKQSTHESLRSLVDAKPKKMAAKTKSRTKTKVKPQMTGRLFHLDEFSDVKLDRYLKQIGIQRPLVIEDIRIRMTVHKLRNRVFIAVVNDGNEDIQTTVQREGKFVLKDFWDENKYWGGNGEIKIHLPARRVKFWELIEC